MKYHKTEAFSKEEIDVPGEDEETTKQIVMINLKSINGGFDRALLNNLLDQAIEKTKVYKIFNCDKGLLVEKSMIKSK